MNCPSCQAEMKWRQGGQSVCDQCGSPELSLLRQVRSPQAFSNCPICGTKSEQVLKTSYVGCPACYEFLAEAILKVRHPSGDSAQ